MEKLLDSIKSIVTELQGIRHIPQFLFVDEISLSSVIKLRTEVLKVVDQENPPKEIDFIINSPGGNPHDAYRLIRTLRKNFESVNIIIPFWAKSATTLFALGGNKVIFDEFGEFGPIDMQIAKERDDSPSFDRESALNDEHSLQILETRAWQLYHSMFKQLFRSDLHINKIELSSQIFNYITKFYQPLVRQVNPYKLGEKKRKLEITERYAEIILKTYNKEIDETTQRWMIDYLVNKCPDHTFVVDYDLMKQFLPKVVYMSTEIGEEYARVLTKLSMAFLSDVEDTLNFVGFIENKAEVTQATKNDNSLTNSTVDNKINAEKLRKSH